MKHFIPIVVLLFIICSGCDRGKVPGLVQLEGIVTHNGEPLAEAVINFQPIAAGRAAYATTDAAGQFKTTTIDPDDGIVKGQYKVSISKYVITRYIRHADGDEPVAENMLPKHYSSSETPLTLDISAKKLDAKFELMD